MKKFNFILLFVRERERERTCWRDVGGEGRKERIRMRMGFRGLTNCMLVMLSISSRRKKD